ncbi:MAG: hypothetical protein KDD40_11175, partial [Bdellovibrionales bacterium]|nr:hypothetical protein [Bdellovibrionales bacterium]
QLEYASNLQGLISEAKASLTHEHDFLLINQLQVSSVHLARTAFEKKYTQRGETCYRLTFSV